MTLDDFHHNVRGKKVFCSASGTAEMKLLLTTSIQTCTHTGYSLLLKKAVICSLPIQTCE